MAEDDVHDMHNGKCVVEGVQGVGGCRVALSMVFGMVVFVVVCVKKQVKQLTR